jgi:hypothetical protein
MFVGFTAADSPLPQRALTPCPRQPRRENRARHGSRSNTIRSDPRQVPPASGQRPAANSSRGGRAAQDEESFK